MKNYKVKAIENFNDKEEKDFEGNNIYRTKEKSEWYCTKERYEYLSKLGYVKLVEIKKKGKEDEQFSNKVSKK